MAFQMKSTCFLALQFSFKVPLVLAAVAITLKGINTVRGQKKVGKKIKI